MKLVVTGSRSWALATRIRQTLIGLQEEAGEEPVVLIHGDARGADRLAGEVAAELGWTVRPMPAAWRVTDETPSWAIRQTSEGLRYDLRAGPARNRAMLDERPDLVVAFTDELKGGTGDCVAEARRRGLPTLVVGAAGITEFTHGSPSLF